MRRRAGQGDWLPTTWLLLLLGWAALGVSQPSLAATEGLQIAAASELHSLFKELVPEFEQATRIHIDLVLGASGTLYSRVLNGDPFDLYFSRDIRYSRKLEETGYAVRGSLVRYAPWRLVLWTPTWTDIPVETLGMQALRNPAVHKIAVPNPSLSAHGHAAIAAMKHFRVYESVKDRLVFGDSSEETADMVKFGPAEVGIIPLSLAVSAELTGAGRYSGRYWRIPPSAYPDQVISSVMLRGARHRDQARKFLAFLQSKPGQKLMERYGVHSPEPR